MPVEKSIRGNGRGVTINVASQFTIVTASWLVTKRKSTMSGASRAQPIPGATVLATRAAVAMPVIAAIDPR
jgi:hypothetical protein